ncbi:MAG: HAMP domain-containing sensor histidine kinase [Cyanobacteria bacterium P01_E01_bin.42]
MGLLYLEHDTSTGVFSPDRLEVLQILTAQAAIALENSLLYSNLAIANQELAQYNMTLEQKVQRRTEQLHEKNLALENNLADLKPARTYIQDLFDLLDLYRQNYPQSPEKIQDAEEDIELEFVKADLPKILDSMQTGSQRIKTIVEGLRIFSRLDEAEYKIIDNLHANIESTLMLLQHHLRQTSEYPEIVIIKEYGELPPITCYASQLNQVFFNLLSNAIDALRSGDRTSSEPPAIHIHTEAREGKAIRIAIADNGCGMDEATRQKVFEPFFTTKLIGSGTGLGLSTSYEIVVEHHKGAISCQSQLGEGTELILEIPIQRVMKNMG